MPIDLHSTPWDRLINILNSFPDRDVQLKHSHNNVTKPINGQRTPLHIILYLVQN